MQKQKAPQRLGNFHHRWVWFRRMGGMAIMRPIAPQRSNVFAYRSVSLCYTGKHERRVCDGSL